MRDFPRLSWLNAKCQPQQNGGHKNNPGCKEEHTDAITRAIVEEARKFKEIHETPNVLEHN